MSNRNDMIEELVAHILKSIGGDFDCISLHDTLYERFSRLEEETLVKAWAEIAMRCAAVTLYRMENV